MTKYFIWKNNYKISSLWKIRETRLFWCRI